MPTTDNVRVFPEKAGIRERGFATRVTGRLDDSNSIVFGELLREWHCHFTGNPKAVLPYLKNPRNLKKLDLGNPEHRENFSKKWKKTCEAGQTKPITETIIPVEQCTHDVIHLIFGLPPTWMAEHHVHYAQPVMGLQLGYGMRGFSFNRDGVSKQLSISELDFFKELGVNENLKSWHAKSLLGTEGVLSAYFSAMMIGAINIKKESRISENAQQGRLTLHSTLNDQFLAQTVAAQWRYAGLLTSLVEINRDGGNPVDVTEPWNLVALRVPLDVVCGRLRGAFPVRQEDKQAIRDWKEAFGEDAAGVPLIEPRLLCFPPTLRNRIQAFEAEYGKESATLGDPLSPNMSLFPSITPYLDQRESANRAIQLVSTYDRWARIQRGEVELTRLETLAARARRSAARPSQERPPVDIDIGGILLKEFTQLVTR